MNGEDGVCGPTYPDKGWGAKGYCNTGLETALAGVLDFYQQLHSVEDTFLSLINR